MQPGEAVLVRVAEVAKGWTGKLQSPVLNNLVSSVLLCTQISSISSVSEVTFNRIFVTSGNLKLGFTAHNPEQLTALPKYSTLQHQS